VKVALRQRESLATLRVREGVFVLEMMLWPDEIRVPAFGFLDDDIDVRPQELQMAQSLIETMAGDFAPEQYTDNYREALQTLIDAKVAGREVVAPAEPASEPGTVVDLMAALRASVEAAREGRGDRSADVQPAANRSGAKKSTAAKKASAKAPATKATKKAPSAAKGAAKRPSAGSAKKATTKRTNTRKSA
jgi:DNA end-binding protein Ku